MLIGRWLPLVVRVFVVVAAVAALILVPAPRSLPDLPLWARPLVALAKSGPILVVLGVAAWRARRARPDRAVLGLVVLSPLVAEYLLGNVPAVELPAAPILMLLYGCAALGIREAARRTGRGWPTILTLAAAFGFLLAGVIDQTLFDPEVTSWDVEPAAPVPALGISAYNTLAFVAGHVVWSIGVPVAIVEAMATGRGDRPWLGRPGLLWTAGGFTLGAVVVNRFIAGSGDALASPSQLTGVLLIVVVLVALAFRFPVTRSPRDEVVGPPDRAGSVPDGSVPDGSVPDGRRAPREWAVGTAAFVTTSGFVARPEDWLGGVAGGLVLLAAAAVVVGRWARRPGWGPRHRFALAAGASLTYAWLGFVLLFLTGATTPVNLVGQVGFVVALIVLLVLGRRVVR